MLPNAQPVKGAVLAVRRRAWIAVGVLLAIYVGLALWAVRVKGAAFDEGEHLFSGYNIWLRSDFRMETANGDFVKRWVTLPYLFTRPKFVSTTGPAWRSGDAYWAGSRFLFELGNDADSLLRQGRVMILLLGIATGLLVFVCARDLFGWGGGVLALGVFVFSPNMLAFGSIVSTEMSLCFALLGSTWLVWRLLQRITWRRIAGSLAIFALLVLSKPTAVLILPTVALMLVIKLAIGRPLVVELGPRRVVTTRRAQLKYFFALILAHAGIGWATIWAHYDFRYAASPNPEDPSIATMVRPQRDPISPLAQSAIEAARRWHAFPEGYLHGVEWLLGHDDERHAFLAGEWTYGGWRHFFLRAALAKTRPAFVALLVFGLGWWIVRWWRTRRRASETNAALGLPSFYEALPFLALAAVYLPAAILQNLNIGHRHILPLYPPGYVLTGSIALMWIGARPWLRAVIVVLCVYFVAETLAIAPNYLAYFSPLTGGPSKGYTQLVDSSLDWGMNLPNLKRWLDKNNPGDREPLYLAYFGTDSPDYRGIKCRRLPGFFEPPRGPSFPLQPGLYAISATLLQTVYTRTFGPWNKVYERDYQETRQHIAAFEATAPGSAARDELIRHNSAERWVAEYEAFDNLRFGRLCAYLRQHGPPDEAIGYAILIWRLDVAELRAALEGPPVELADEPIRPP
jgi:hypothetical protein